MSESSRTPYFLLILLSVFAGCAGSPHVQCGEVVDSSARLLDEAPADEQALLDLLIGEEKDIQTVRTKSGRKLAWFHEGRDSVTLCSYRPSRDACDRDVYAVNFRLVNGSWTPIGDLVPITLCIQFSGGPTKGR